MALFESTKAGLVQLECRASVVVWLYNEYITQIHCMKLLEYLVDFYHVAPISSLCQCSQFDLLQSLIIVFSLSYQ